MPLKHATFTPDEGSSSGYSPDLASPVIQMQLQEINQSNQSAMPKTSRRPSFLRRMSLSRKKYPATFVTLDGDDDHLAATATSAAANFTTSSLSNNSTRYFSQDDQLQEFSSRPKPEFEEYDPESYGSYKLARTRRIEYQPRHNGAPNSFQSHEKLSVAPATRLLKQKQQQRQSQALLLREQEQMEREKQFQTHSMHQRQRSLPHNAVKPSPSMSGTRQPGQRYSHQRSKSYHSGSSHTYTPISYKHESYSHHSFYDEEEDEEEEEEEDAHYSPGEMAMRRHSTSGHRRSYTVTGGLQREARRSVSLNLTPSVREEELSPVLASRPHGGTTINHYRINHYHYYTSPQIPTPEEDHGEYEEEASHGVQEGEDEVAGIAGKDAYYLPLQRQQSVRRQPLEPHPQQQQHRHHRSQSQGYSSAPFSQQQGPQQTQPHGVPVWSAASSVAASGGVHAAGPRHKGFLQQPKTTPAQPSSAQPAQPATTKTKIPSSRHNTRQKSLSSSTNSAASSHSVSRASSVSSFVSSNSPTHPILTAFPPIASSPNEEDHDREQLVRHRNPHKMDLSATADRDKPQRSRNPHIRRQLDLVRSHSQTKNTTATAYPSDQSGPTRHPSRSRQLPNQFHTIPSLEQLNIQEFGSSLLMIRRKTSVTSLRGNAFRRFFVRLFRRRTKPRYNYTKNQLLNRSKSKRVGANGASGLNRRAGSLRLNSPSLGLQQPPQSRARQYKVKSLQLLHLNPKPVRRLTPLGSNISRPLLVTKYAGVDASGSAEILSIRSGHSSGALRIHPLSGRPVSSRSTLASYALPELARLPPPQSQQHHYYPQQLHPRKRREPGHIVDDDDANSDDIYEDIDDDERNLIPSPHVYDEGDINDAAYLVASDPRRSSTRRQSQRRSGASRRSADLPPNLEDARDSLDKRLDIIQRNLDEARKIKRRMTNSTTHRQPPAAGVAVAAAAGAAAAGVAPAAVAASLSQHRRSQSRRSVLSNRSSYSMLYRRPSLARTHSFISIASAEDDAPPSRRRSTRDPAYDPLNPNLFKPHYGSVIRRSDILTDDYRIPGVNSELHRSPSSASSSSSKYYNEDYLNEPIKVEEALAFVNTWSSYLRRAIAVRIILRQEMQGLDRAKLKREQQEWEDIHDLATTDSGASERNGSSVLSQSPDVSLSPSSSAHATEQFNYTHAHPKRHHRIEADSDESFADEVESMSSFHSSSTSSHSSVGEHSGTDHGDPNRFSYEPSPDGGSGGSHAKHQPQYPPSRRQQDQQKDSTKNSGGNNQGNAHSRQYSVQHTNLYPSYATNRSRYPDTPTSDYDRPDSDDDLSDDNEVFVDAVSSIQHLPVVAAAPLVVGTRAPVKAPVTTAVVSAPVVAVAPVSTPLSHKTHRRTPSSIRRALRTGEYQTRYSALMSPILDTTPRLNKTPQLSSSYASSPASMAFAAPSPRELSVSAGASPAASIESQVPPLPDMQANEYMRPSANLSRQYRQPLSSPLVLDSGLAVVSTAPAPSSSSVVRFRQRPASQSKPPPAAASASSQRTPPRPLPTVPGSTEVSPANSSESTSAKDTSNSSSSSGGPLKPETKTEDAAPAAADSNEGEIMTSPIAKSVSTPASAPPGNTPVAPSASTTSVSASAAATASAALEELHDDDESSSVSSSFQKRIVSAPLLSASSDGNSPAQLSDGQSFRSSSISESGSEASSSPFTKLSPQTQSTSFVAASAAVPQRSASYSSGLLPGRLTATASSSPSASAASSRLSSRDPSQKKERVSGVSLDGASARRHRAVSHSGSYSAGASPAQPIDTSSFRIPKVLQEQYKISDRILEDMVQEMEELQQRSTQLSAKSQRQFSILASSSSSPSSPLSSLPSSAGSSIVSSPAVDLDASFTTSRPSVSANASAAAVAATTTTLARLEGTASALGSSSAGSSMSSLNAPQTLSSTTTTVTALPTLRATASASTPSPAPSSVDTRRTQVPDMHPRAADDSFASAAAAASGPSKFYDDDGSSPEPYSSGSDDGALPNLTSLSPARVPTAAAPHQALAGTPTLASSGMPATAQQQQGRLSSSSTAAKGKGRSSVMSSSSTATATGTGTSSSTGFTVPPGSAGTTLFHNQRASQFSSNSEYSPREGESSSSDESSRMSVSQFPVRMPENTGEYVLHSPAGSSADIAHASSGSLSQHQDVGSSVYGTARTASSGHSMATQQGHASQQALDAEPLPLPKPIGSSYVTTSGSATSSSGSSGASSPVPRQMAIHPDIIAAAQQQQQQSSAHSGLSRGKINRRRESPTKRQHPHSFADTDASSTYHHRDDNSSPASAASALPRGRSDHMDLSTKYYDSLSGPGSASSLHRYLDLRAAAAVSGADRSGLGTESSPGSGASSPSSNGESAQRRIGTSWVKMDA